MLKDTALAKKYGIDPGIFKEALENTGAKSYQSDVRLEDMIKGSFLPRFYLDYVVKDLGIALELGKEKNFPLILTSLILEIYKITSNLGYGKEDASAIFRFYQVVSK